MHSVDIEGSKRDICSRRRATEVRRCELCCSDFVDRPLRNPRISALELLDEVEELNILLAHYALSWAVKVPTESKDQSWLGWDLTPITTDVR